MSNIGNERRISRLSSRHILSRDEGRRFAQHPERRGNGTITRFGLEEYVADCVILLDHRISEQVSTRRMRIQYGLQLQVSATDYLNHLDDHFRVMIFQTVRELLFNIIKHAGTPEASILMERMDGRCRITIADSGKGFDPNILTQHPWCAHGILLLRDRLMLMGRTMTIHSKPGDGTRIVIEFPMNENLA